MTLQTGHKLAAVSPSGSGFGLLDGCIAVAENIKLLVLVPLIVGLAGYGIASTQPKTYASVAYLALQGNFQHKSQFNQPIQSLQPLPTLQSVQSFRFAPSAEALIRSPAVLGAVLKKYPDPAQAGMSPEAQFRLLNKRLKMAIAPGNVRKPATLYSLQVEDHDPARARTLNAALIDAWLQASKPRPVEKLRYSKFLARQEAQLNSITSLIGRLGKAAAAQVGPGSRQDEMATSLVLLNNQRTNLVRSIMALQAELEIGNRDIIISPPSLPTEPNGPRRLSWAVLPALVTGFILLLFVLLRHGARSAGPETVEKLARLGAALKPWGRKS